MYLYFNSQGILKEVVNDKAIRQGSTGNFLYVYMEGVEYDKIEKYYPAPTAYTDANINYRLIGEEPQSDTIESLSDIKEISTIPYDKNRRDLKFFKGGFKYEFWKIEIPAEVTGNKSGTIDCSIELFPETSVLGMIVFDIERGAMKEIAPITHSQYTVLLDIIANKLNRVDTIYKVSAYPSDSDLDLFSVGQAVYFRNNSNAKLFEVTSNHELNLVFDFLAYYTKSEIDTSLDEKVDKVLGKGLSTNDFTNEEKQKLASLENYDDTDIVNRITDIKSVIPQEASGNNKLADKNWAISKIDEYLQGKVSAIVVDNTNTYTKIRNALLEVSSFKAKLEDGTDITNIIKSDVQTYNNVINNLFTNTGTDFSQKLTYNGYVVYKKGNNYIFYKCDENSSFFNDNRGNLIFVLQTDVPDWWVEGYGIFGTTPAIKINVLESKVDLSNYITNEDLATYISGTYEGDYWSTIKIGNVTKHIQNGNSKTKAIVVDNTLHLQVVVSDLRASDEYSACLEDGTDITESLKNETFVPILNNSRYQNVNPTLKRIDLPENTYTVELNKTKYIFYKVDNLSNFFNTQGNIILSYRSGIQELWVDGYFEDSTSNYVTLRPFYAVGGSGGTSDFDELTNRPKYNGSTMTSTTNIPEVKTDYWDNKVSYYNINSSVTWSSLKTLLQELPGLVNVYDVNGTNINSQILNDTYNDEDYPLLNKKLLSDTSSISLTDSNIMLSTKGGETLSYIFVSSTDISNGYFKRGDLLEIPYASLFSLNTHDNQRIIGNDGNSADLLLDFRAFHNRIIIDNTLTDTLIVDSLEDDNSLRAYNEFGIDITEQVKSGEIESVANTDFGQNSYSSGEISLESIEYLVEFYNNKYIYYKMDSYSHFKWKFGNIVSTVQQGFPSWYVNSVSNTGKVTFKILQENITKSYVDERIPETDDFVLKSNLPLNVKDYGVKGDGTTDDTNAINSLIANAENNTEIYFPEGIYIVSPDASDDYKCIKIENKTGLRITLSPKAIIKREYHAIVESDQTTYTYRIIAIYNSNDITINGGKLLGDLESHTSNIPHDRGHGFRLDKTTNITIENVEIAWMSGDGISTTNSNIDNNVIVRNCYINNFVRNGITIAHCNGFEVRDCNIYKSWCIFDFGCGIDQEDEGTIAHTTNVSFINCNIDLPNEMGTNLHPIVLNNASNAIIDNVICSDNQFHNASPVGNVKLTNCIIPLINCNADNMIFDSCELESITSYPTTSSNIKFFNCKIDKSSKSGNLFGLGGSVASTLEFDNCKIISPVSQGTSMFASSSSNIWSISIKNCEINVSTTQNNFANNIVNIEIDNCKFSVINKNISGYCIYISGANETLIKDTYFDLENVVSSHSSLLRMNTTNLTMINCYANGGTSTSALIRKEKTGNGTYINCFTNNFTETNWLANEGTQNTKIYNLVASDTTGGKLALQEWVTSNFTNVEANPANVGTLLLSKLKVGNTIYNNHSLQTTAPTAAITDGGIHIVVLSAEPQTKYNGYIYLIEESA